MTSPSFRDMEQLSAYLDGQISQSKRTRLEIRVKSTPALAAALEELRQTRGLLRRTPQRRAPRNFTLTPKMAGLRPPIPRLVPALSWASAVAMVLFIFTLGTSLVGQLSFGASAPMMAAAPNGLGGGQEAAATMAPATAVPAMMAPATAAPATMAPAIPAPATVATATVVPEAMAPATAVSATERTTDQTILATPTVEVFVMSVPEATTPATTSVSQPSPALKVQPRRPINPWLFVWPVLGVLLGMLALLIRWLNQLDFRQKNRRG